MVLNQVIFEIVNGKGEPHCPRCNKTISNSEINVTAFWETLIVPISNSLVSFVDVSEAISISAYFHVDCLEQVANPMPSNFLWIIRPEYVQMALQKVKQKGQLDD